jgi:PleD family two-component response regulator
MATLSFASDKDYSVPLVTAAAPLNRTGKKAGFGAGSEPDSSTFSKRRFDRPLQVLVVDDSSMIRKMTKKSLVYYGHSVDEASEGSEAVEMIKKKPYDVVLMDINMPVQSTPVNLCNVKYIFYF